MILTSRLLFFIIITAIFAGCAYERPTPPDESIIEFLEDGLTTKKEAILELGYPSGKFEGERILTYRLSYSSEQKWRVREKVDPYDWQLVKYSLVLVFDDNNVLEKHSLVPIE